MNSAEIFPLLERKKVPGCRFNSLCNSPKHWPRQFCFKVLCRGSANSKHHNVRLKHPRHIRQGSFTFKTHAVCTQYELSHIFFMSKVGQKEEINSGFGEFDQVNRPQSRGRLNKDTVSLLVQRTVMHPFWDQARNI